MTLHEPLTIQLLNPTECIECAEESDELCLRCPHPTCVRCCPRIQEELLEEARDREFDEKCALGYI